jgi:hypothetical protein
MAVTRYFSLALTVLGKEVSKVIAFHCGIGHVPLVDVSPVECGFKFTFISSKYMYSMKMWNIICRQPGGIHSRRVYESST